MQFTTLNLKTVSGPTSLASAALSDIKEHLKVTSTYEDDLIQIYIEAAIGLVETYCGISIGQRVYQLNMPHFPRERFIEMPRGPVSSVGALYYYDTSNVQTLWAASDYETSLDEIPARLYLQQGDNWESTYERPDAVTLQYTTGVNAWSAVTERQRLPIYYLVTHQHRFRQPVVAAGIQDVPWALRANLQSLREDFQTG